MGEITCRACRFGELTLRRTGGFVAWPVPKTKWVTLCRRHPNHVDRLPDDWCGEFRERSLAKDEERHA